MPTVTRNFRSLMVASLGVVLIGAGPALSQDSDQDYDRGDFQDRSSSARDFDRQESDRDWDDRRQSDAQSRSQQQQDRDYDDRQRNIRGGEARIQQRRDERRSARDYRRGQDWRDQQGSQSSDIRRQLDELDRQVRLLSSRIEQLRSRLGDSGYQQGGTTRSGVEQTGYYQDRQYRDTRQRRSDVDRPRDYDDRRIQTRNYRGSSNFGSDDPSRAVEGASGRDYLRSRTDRVND